MKFNKKHNLLLIIVDVSASTGAFVGTVCLIAVGHSVSGWTGCRWCGRVDKTPRLCSSTYLVPSWYVSPPWSICPLCYFLKQYWELSTRRTSDHTWRIVCKHGHYINFGKTASNKSREDRQNGSRGLRNWLMRTGWSNWEYKRWGNGDYTCRLDWSEVSKILNEKERVDKAIFQPALDTGSPIKRAFAETFQAKMQNESTEDVFSMNGTDCHSMS